MTMQEIKSEIKMAAEKGIAAAVVVKSKDAVAYERLVNRINDTVADMDAVDDFDFGFYKIDSSKKVSERILHNAESQVQRKGRI